MWPCLIKKVRNLPVPKRVGSDYDLTKNNSVGWI
jgi:hypothetical protein